MLKQDPKPEFPLTGREKYYKQKYLDTAESDFTNLLSEQMYGDTLPRFLDEGMIPSDLDIAVYRQIRYLPSQYHTHEFFEVVYVASGLCINYIAKQKIEMNEGDLCIIAPDTLHCIDSYRDDCIIFNYLIRTSTFHDVFFDIIHEKNVLSLFFLNSLSKTSSSPYLLFHTSKSEHLSRLLLRAYEEYNANLRYKKSVLKNLMGSIFIYLLRNHEKDVVIPNPTGKQSDSNMIFIINFIESNYFNLTLKKLAAFFNYSERQMIRLIKDYTNSSFQEIVNSLKINKANQLLRGTDSIEKIALEIGFSSAANFCRFYKNTTGKTPTEFRNDTNVKS